MQAGRSRGIVGLWSMPPLNELGRKSAKKFNTDTGLWIVLLLLLLDGGRIVAVVVVVLYREWIEYINN